MGRKFFKLICLLAGIAIGAGGYFYWTNADPKQKEEFKKQAEDSQEKIKEGYEGAKEKVKQGYQGAKKKLHDYTED